jgi:hypothetical protein
MYTSGFAIGQVYAPVMLKLPFASVTAAGESSAVAPTHPHPSPQHKAATSSRSPAVARPSPRPAHPPGQPSPGKILARPRRSRIESPQPQSPLAPAIAAKSSTS